MRYVMFDNDLKYSHDSSDNLFEIDNVYEIERGYEEEYEPVSDIDSDTEEREKNGKKRNKNAQYSDSDTDLEDVVVFAATLFELADDTDLAEWADSSDTELSDSGIETPNTHLVENKNSCSPIKAIENDVGSTTTNVVLPLNCITCDKPDDTLHPLMRECHGCWQKRRGQKPDRPKPRRRKNKGKGKKSNIQAFELTRQCRRCRSALTLHCEFATGASFLRIQFALLF